MTSLIHRLIKKQQNRSEARIAQKKIGKDDSDSAVVKLKKKQEDDLEAKGYLSTAGPFD